jgi:hypothetical protein
LPDGRRLDAPDTVAAFPSTIDFDKNINLIVVQWFFHRLLR